LTRVTEEYERDGYTIVRGLLGSSLVAQCREHLGQLQEICEQGGGVGPPAARAVGPAAPGAVGPAAADRALLAVPVGTDAFVTSVAANGQLTGLAARLLGSVEVACFGFTYMVKAPRSGLPAWWHQDGHPWRERLGIESAVTLWIALDRADADNGALYVVAGSHTSPVRPLVAAKVVAPDGADGPGMFPGGIDPGLLDPSRIRVLVMAAGDVSAHHPALVHGSGANRSDRIRRALALRYRPA
jgi:ectoine hydroxylase-related dioxygenase (phytanoyl-CoA dioxygenase family)